MKYTTIPNTDIHVSAIAMGCMTIIPSDTQDKSDSVAALEAAYDHGITLFDTAEAYGDGASELLIGETFHNKRDKVVIATKVSGNHLRPANLIAACEASLKRLRTDYIDLYQIHWADWSVPFDEPMETLQLLQQQGKIRAIGVSNFGVRDMTDMLRHGIFVTNQLPYNLIWRAIEYGIQEFCDNNNIGILCYSPMMAGLLTGKFSNPNEVPDDRSRSRHFSGDRPNARHGEPGCETETFETIINIRKISEQIGEPMANVAIAWLMAQPAISSVLVGGRTVQQIQRNSQATELCLPQKILDELTNATEQLKTRLGTNADLWQSDSRIR